MKIKLGLSLNIYIYGSQNFKKDIKDELNRSHIDFKLGDNGLIQDVQSLDTLKELIEDNSEDVFLIDDGKIIKENLINSKIKFLKPKDGIEQEYLNQKGIDDLSVDSIADISKYILKKMKDLGLDDDDDDFDDRQIHDSITNIVNDAYNHEDDETQSEENYELSDDLKDLLAQDDDSLFDDDLINENASVEMKEEEPLSQEEPAIETNELDEMIDEEPIINTDTETEKTFESITSIEEMDELIDFEDITSLDELTEDDILSALSGEDIKPRVAKKIENKATEMSLKLDNPNDIKEFLTKLLESKALEITVKIKE